MVYIIDYSTGRILQVELIENGKGLQYLVNEAYKILGNPLLLHNMEYELIACSENVITDDPLWNEVVGAGVFSNESIKFFMEECFIDTVASTESVALLKSDKLRYDRLYGRVFNCYNSTVADLIMLACDKPFEDQDIVLFEAFCRKVSKEIGTSEFFKSYGILYHEKLICKLLDAHIDDKVIYSDHMANLYEGLKRNLYVVAADIGECNAREKTLEEIRALFREVQQESKCAVYSNYIVVIAGTDEESLNAERDLHKLNGYFNGNNIRAGVSSLFDNLFDLRKYYNEAVDSLKRGPEGGFHR